MENKNKYILGSIRFYYAQSVFSSKCHYKAFDRLHEIKERNSKFVKTITGITILLLILQIIGLEFRNEKLLNIVAYIGLLSTGTSLFFEFYTKEDISLLMFKHEQTAESYKQLRGQFHSLMIDILSEEFDNIVLLEKKDLLINKYNSIGDSSPNTNYQDYQNTQKSLGLGNNRSEEFTWSDEEIDKFLPNQLRLTTHAQKNNHISNT